MPLNPCFLGYFGNFLGFLLTALSQVRVLPGELFEILRKKSPNQLTPGAEKSVAGRFALLAFNARICDDSATARKVSVSRESIWGPKGTLKVPSAPRNFGPKLSDSLINNPPKVNRLVPFGARKGH